MPVEVVPEPGVDHGVYRDGGLQRRVRVEERHQGQQAVVGSPGDADAAVVPLDVLHQPLDRVPGVGDLVDAAFVERPAQRHGHGVPAPGAEAAAHVLVDADVAVPHQGLVVGGQDHGDVGAVGARGAVPGVVGSPRQHDRHLPRGPVRDQDKREQLDAVAHRHHRLDAPVVEVRGSRLEGAGNVSRSRVTSRDRDLLLRFAMLFPGRLSERVVSVLFRLKDTGGTFRFLAPPLFCREYRCR